MRDFIFIGIIKLSCFYFAISYLFAKSTHTKIENYMLCLDCSQPSIFSCFFFSINERAVRTTRKLDASAKRLKNREAVDSLCCVWLLITFAFASVLIHGLHLKWSLHSSCLITFGMFSFSYLVN